MQRLVWSFVLASVLGFAACSKRQVDDKSDGGGATGGAIAGSNGGASAGSNGGSAIAGASGGASAGSNGGSAGVSAGSNGGGAIAGASGGAIAGASGGAAAGSNGGARGGAGGGGTAGSGGGGTSGLGGGGSGGSSAGLGPIRLFVFYTRWGTQYPDWFPTGSDRDFTMRPMLQPLEASKGGLLLISGLTNANLYTDGSGTTLRGANSLDSGDAMISLLTARPATPSAPAQGPSLDTVVGNCGGAAGDPLRLAVGQFGYDDNPGISFGADGAPIRGEHDPRAVAMRVLGHTVTAPDPSGDIDTIYPALGSAHMDVAVEALATGKTCAVTLMWGDHMDPAWLGITTDAHSLSHLAPGLYAAVSVATPQFDPAGMFVKLQNWYAQQFASLLDRLRAVPLGAGTLLDRSVVIWLSESGTGSDNQGYFIPVVIAGGGGGRLDVGRFLEIKTRPVPAADLQTVTRTQGDLLAALAQIWGIQSFGDPRITRQPLTEILKP